MRRAAPVLAALALSAGCGGEEERQELPPGSVARIGVVSAAGPRDALVPQGVQVASASINAAGGIGGAATIELVVGPVERLLARGLQLLVLACDQATAAEAARVVAEAGAVATAPCDDGGLPMTRNVFPTGLSPARQADLLADEVGGRAAVREGESERGRRVQEALQGLVEPAAGPVVSPEAPERVRPDPGTEGTLFATYGFPEPGGETDEFYERFKALFDRRPASIVAALAADALVVLAAAIELAGTTDPAAVAAVFRDEGVEVGGVLGEIEFAGGTEPARTPGVVLRVEDGRYRLVARSD